ncbi:hypothetical protein [Reyranella sp.]|jgi:hypothetical protein|uniref:hypothetical protein n=1 Tax=Reyranella sp. TaxID=1929291 RepID=UPI002F9572F5
MRDTFSMGFVLDNFPAQFARFQRLIAANDKGHAFTNFREGIAAVWEAYKPRLRQHALTLLKPQEWQRHSAGSGEILKCVIAAIEIQDSQRNLINNLVFWQNRYGHANREHRVLLEAVSDERLRRDLESELFILYRGQADEEGSAFDGLRTLTDGKYPLLAYLFFLKDMDRFAPIQPTTFDHAFRALHIELVTLHNCSWSNYQQFNAALGAIQSALAALPGLTNVRLIDAHSFCWLLARLKDDPGHSSNAAKADAGRVLSARQKAIVDMRLSILNTVKYSNGQLMEKTIKNKETSLNPLQLDELLASLLDLQGNRCALTGIPFDFVSAEPDRALLPSPDRIDSNGHYVPGNLQVVCRFINSWKGASDNEEFKRLLMFVREAGQ